MMPPNPAVREKKKRAGHTVLVNGARQESETEMLGHKAVKRSKKAYARTCELKKNAKTLSTLSKMKYPL
jgi:hypothetical protein